MIAPGTLRICTQELRVYSALIANWDTRLVELNHNDVLIMICESFNDNVSMWKVITPKGVGWVYKYLCKRDTTEVTL